MQDRRPPINRRRWVISLLGMGTFSALVVLAALLADASRTGLLVICFLLIVPVATALTVWTLKGSPPK